MQKVIVSLCDYSGNWPRFYREAGYSVVQIDLKHGDDVRDTRAVIEKVSAVLRERESRVAGVLCAPPCTEFTVSGAQYWPAKDADGRTAQALEIVDACCAIAEVYVARFGAWWALENPVGRLPKLRPQLLRPWWFNPCDYAGFAPDPEKDRYTKKTGIYGTAVKPDTAPREPIRVCSQGSWIQKLGGKSERTKELRSTTPLGFARAFFLANP
jgi:hypothetical protein